MPVPEGIHRCERILELAEGDPLIEASTARYLASLEARRAEFMKRFEGARHALIEVRVMCRDFGAPPSVAYKIEGTGFSDARNALVQACPGSTSP